jgi:hypothetical protein
MNNNFTLFKYDDNETRSALSETKFKRLLYWSIPANTLAKQ